MALQAMVRTVRWEREGQASTTILVIVSMIENCVPSPSESSIRKNNVAQR